MTIIQGRITGRTFLAAAGALVAGAALPGAARAAAEPRRGNPHHARDPRKPANESR
ncbi:MAG TPA: hypothetical protein VIL43_11290 [Burkholderiales bacterium]